MRSELGRDTGERAFYAFKNLLRVTPSMHNIVVFDAGFLPGIPMPSMPVVAVSASPDCIKVDWPGWADGLGYVSEAPEGEGRSRVR